MAEKGIGAGTAQAWFKQPDAELSRWPDHQESRLWRQKAATTSRPPQPQKAVLARKEL